MVVMSFRNWWKLFLLFSVLIWSFGACASVKEDPVQKDAVQKDVGTDYDAQLAAAKKAARNSVFKNNVGSGNLSDLHYAAGWGSVDLARYILQRDGDVDVNDNFARTPLLYAAGFNNTEMLDFLLGADAKLEAKNKVGSRAMHLAAGFNNDVRVLDKLISAGADVNQPNDLGSTPLHWAAGSAALPQTKLLLERGARLNTRDKSGRTPMSVAKSPSAWVSSQAREAEVAFLQAAGSSRK